MELQNIDLDTLATFIPNKNTLYRIMVEKDYYLPSITSKACSEEYLLGCLKGKYFTIKITELKPYVLWRDLKSNKLELFDEIVKKASKSLGFSIHKLPEKEYLVNVLHTLDKSNRVFKNPLVTTLTRELPEG